MRRHTLLVEADATSVKIAVPQTDLSWEIANVVAYSISREVVVNIGETEEEIEQRLSESGDLDEWSKVRSEIGFLAPFAVDTFHPRFAQDVLTYYGYVARKELKRGRLGLIGKYNYAISIKDYECLPSSLQKEFAHLLGQNLRANQITINGEIFDKWPYRIARWTLKVFLLVAILLGTGFLLWGGKIAGIEGEITQWWELVGLIGAMAVIGSLSIFGGVILWAVVMQRVLPHHTLSVLMPMIGLPKFIFRWLNDMLDNVD